MTLGMRIATGFGVAVATIFLVAPAGATTRITVVRDVPAREAAVSARSPIEVVRDVSSRDAAMSARPRPVPVVRDVAARDTGAHAAGDKAIAYFRANELATLNDDAQAVAALPGDDDVRAARAGGFDWVDAGVGASSALFLMLLVGVSLLAARHFRSAPLPH